MNMRPLGRTGMQVSEVGLGCEHLQGKPFELVKSVIDAALDSGINILDTFMSEPEVRSNIGRALKGRREKVILQGHIGAIWQDGQYKRSRDIAKCRDFVSDYLIRLDTGYIDIGMLHYVDKVDDWLDILRGPVMEYALELKRAGVIRALGMSSHDPRTALEAVRSGLIDVLMFSINPAYDMLGENVSVDELFRSATYERQLTLNPLRAQLYRECESRGVAITVMKSLGAGVLLSDERSPFGQAFTVPQLVHYSLTRPAVCSVLVGADCPEQVIKAAEYEQTGDSGRDYARVMMHAPRFSLKGHCMYCNHCLPCPSHIDIALVNKYLDLALAQKEVPESVREHYLALDHTARNCIACGKCEFNCPFDVPVKSRMQRALSLFGR